jgi:hypothetical protein
MSHGVDGRSAADAEAAGPHPVGRAGQDLVLEGAAGVAHDIGDAVAPVPVDR